MNEALERNLKIVELENAMESAESQIPIADQARSLLEAEGYIIMAPEDVLAQQLEIEQLKKSIHRNGTVDRPRSEVLQVNYEIDDHQHWQYERMGKDDPGAKYEYKKMIVQSLAKELTQQLMKKIRIDCDHHYETMTRRYFAKIDIGYLGEDNAFNKYNNYRF